MTLCLLPFLVLADSGPARVRLAFVLGAAPSLAAYAVLPVFAVAAVGKGRQGRALAWLGLASGAGGTLGPWAGGWVADVWGAPAGLLMLSVASAAALAALAGVGASVSQAPSRAIRPGRRAAVRAV